MRLLLLTAVVAAILFDLGESAEAANRSNSRYAATVNYQPRESETLHRTGQVAECLRSLLRNHRGLRMARSADSPTSIVECLKLMVRGQSSNVTQVPQLKKEVRVEKTIRAEVNPKRKQKCIHRVLVADNSGLQKQANSDIYGQKIQATSKTGEAANKVVRVPDDGVRVFAPQPVEARTSSQPVEQHPEQHQSRDVPASAESHEDPDESGELLNAEEHQDSDEQPTPVKPVAGQQPELDAADQVESVSVAAVKDPSAKLGAAGQVHSSKVVADVKGASAESKEEVHSDESGEEQHDPNLSQESAENVQVEKKIGQDHKPAAADQVHSAEENDSHEAADESPGQSAEEADSKESNDETVAQQQPAPSSDPVSEEHQSAEDRSTEADDRASGEEHGESVEESDRSKEAARDHEEPQHHEGVEAFREHKPAAADQVRSAEDSREAADESTGSSAEEADSKESNDEVAQQQPAPSSDRVGEERSSAEDRSSEADRASGESVEDSGRSQEAADQIETPHSAHDSERSSEEHKSAEEAHDESSREEHGESAEQPSHATRTSKDSVERVDQQSGEDRSNEAAHDAANSEERSESGEEAGPSREAADSQEHDAASSGSHSAEKASPPAPQMSKEPASAEESAEVAHDDSSQADSEERDRVVQGQAKLKEVESAASHEVEGRHSAAGKSIRIENLKEKLSESFGTSAETIEDERSAEDPEDQSNEFRTGLDSEEGTEGHSVIGAPENDKSPGPKPVRRGGSGEHSAEVADPVAVKQMADIQDPVPTLVSRLKIKPLPREVASSVSNFCIVGKLYVAAQGAVAEQCKVCSAFFQCLGSQQAVNLCRRKDDTVSAESSELDQSGEQRAKKVKVRQSTVVDYVRTITDSSDWNEYLTDEVGTTINQEANDWGRSGKNCYNRFGSVKGCMTPYLCLGYVYP